jgi:addiction module RelE/StbE family toxin
MIIRLHKKFDKSYKKLSSKLKQKVDFTMINFRRNPHDILLRNHPLSGKMNGKRAISVTGNIRIIFEEYDNYVLVIMLDVGTHGQVY